MKFKIVHESRGRIRVQVIQNRMTLEQADLLEAYLCTWPAAQQVTCMSAPAAPLSGTRATGKNF